MPDPNGPYEDTDSPPVPRPAYQAEPEVQESVPQQQIVMNMPPNKEWITPILAIITTLGVFGLFLYLASGSCNAPKEITFYILGASSGFVTTVLGFYFGSSNSGRTKDKTIARMAGAGVAECRYRREVE